MVTAVVILLGVLGVVFAVGVPVYLYVRSKRDAEKEKSQSNKRRRREPLKKVPRIRKWRRSMFGQAMKYLDAYIEGCAHAPSAEDVEPGSGRVTAC